MGGRFSREFFKGERDAGGGDAGGRDAGGAAGNLIHAPVCGFALRFGVFGFGGFSGGRNAKPTGEPHREGGSNEPREGGPGKEARRPGKEVRVRRLG